MIHSIKKTAILPVRADNFTTHFDYEKYTERKMKQTQKKIPVKCGETRELVIERMTDGGDGVARADGFTVFVPLALPHEKVAAKISVVKKNYAVAELTKIIAASPDRIAPRCKIYAECGGCLLQHLSYAAQLKLKRQTVIDAFNHIGGLHNVAVLETLGGNEWHYRNKMQFPVGKRGNKLIVGCFKKGTHEIIPAENCLIQKDGNNEILSAAKETAETLGIGAYNEDTHKGVLRHIMGRATKTGELMAVAVTNTKTLPHEKEFVAALRKRLPNLVSIQQNVQTYRNNVILGRETKILWGRESIVDCIGKMKFHVSARSFFQVNTEQAETLYETALDYADLSGGETVIDAYCGTGTISLFLARSAGRVIGIEIVPQATADAKKNARENRIKNAEFLTGDAARIMPQLFKSGLRPDVIVLDPPRGGCEEKVLAAAANMKPQRIVYVSCNPATLARDTAFLTTRGYFALRVRPVDMFPQTPHIECVALLTKIK